MELEESYWNVLRKWGLVRTAIEEEGGRFRTAEIIPIPQEPFAKAVYRFFSAALASCTQTTELAVRFVNGGSFGLNSL